MVSFKGPRAFNRVEPHSMSSHFHSQTLSLGLLMSFFLYPPPPPTPLSQNPSIELSVYQHMALAAPAFAFSWSQWNGAASRNKFILKACECLKEQSSSEVCGVQRLWVPILDNTAWTRLFNCHGINHMSVDWCFLLVTCSIKFMVAKSAISVRDVLKVL